MQLSPQLSAKFEKLQTSYPFKRSALIPMLMYAQDEQGSISDEMIIWLCFSAFLCVAKKGM